MGEINMNIYKMHNKPTLLLRHATLSPILKQQDIDAFFKTNKLPEHVGKGEDFIATEPFLSAQYAKHVIRGRWKKGEEAISRSAESSYYYSAITLEGEKFPEGEEAISRSAYFSFAYAKIVLKGRFPEGEKAIATDGADSFRYARDVINDEFPLGIEAMKNTSIGFKNVDTTYFDLYQKFLEKKKVTDAKVKDILDNDPLGIL